MGICEDLARLRLRLTGSAMISIRPNGSLGIAVIKNLLNTDSSADGHGSHGFLKDFSVRFREIRPIRVQNHGNSWRALGKQ